MNCSNEEQEGKVELKYCERCGGLWLRPTGADGVYCVSCHALLKNRPDPGDAPARKARRRKDRRRERGPLESELQRDSDYSLARNDPAKVDRLLGVAASEVRA
jgi:Zn-finger nucleic acid-binding protein